MRGLGVLALGLLVAAGPAYAEDGTILLGAAVSLTGKYSTNGKNTRDGYDLAAKQINARGGVKVGGKAYTLKIIYYDDESTPARGAQLAERLIVQDHVQFVLGPYSSGLTKAMAPVTESYKIPMIQANGADRDLFTKGYRFNFAVLSTSDYYLREAVTLLAEQATKAGRDPATLKIAIAIENDPFSADVRAGVIEGAAKYGIKIVVDDKLPAELNDMTATLTKVKALKPDMLVVSGHDKGAILAVRSLAEAKIDVPALAMTQCDSAQIAETLPREAEYAWCAAQWDHTLAYRDDLFGSANDFALLFQKEYNYPTPYQAAESAAAVQVFADAMQRAGSLDPEKVRDAIATTDLMTEYGPIKFDESGKNIAKPMVLYQVQGGKYKVVAPVKFADTPVIYPTPPWSKRP